MIKEEVKEKGVTLISLVVTIVVLLILSGITISTVFSDNGIIAKAKEAKNRTEEAIQKEQSELNQLYNDLASALNSVPEEPKPPLLSDGSYNASKGVNTPKLGSGMTPIKWNGSSWVNTTGSDPEWYDYGTTESTRKWANATTSDGSMWVWIPRYAYSIPSAGYHKSTAAEINIEFMKGTSNESASGRTSFNNASGAENWNIHPAFNYGKPVSGLWVAKFEASSVQGNSNSSSGDNVTSKTVQVKPGVASWRYIEIGNMYTNCLNYDSNTLGNANLNSHMMKNDEWGAVAYLSRSKYGKNAEVWINNSSSYITGSAGNSVSASSDTGTTNDYTSAQGVKASTTGTVHGVYDMSGRAWEYVAAYVNNEDSSLTSYGSALVNGDAKTKNVYSKGSSDNRDSNYSANSGKYGDAVYETSTSGSGSTSWYGNYSIFTNTSYPFFHRGGNYNSAASAGIFCFNGSNGNAYSDSSFRPVLIIL